MEPTHAPPPATSEAARAPADRGSPEVRADGPAAVLAQVQERLAAGEPLSGALASAFYRAVHALDPGATEDTLAPLPGNSGMHLYESLVGWASLGAGERVLDIGCGSGGASRAAAAAVGPEGLVLGIDPSPEALALARARTPAGLPVIYREGWGERLSTIPDRSFDCVLASLVLDQVTSLEGFLREVMRVLRPGGRMVATVTAFDQLRPFDMGLMGSVLAVVARHARGGLVGRASRASIPTEPNDMEAFKTVGLAAPEERGLQLVAVMDDLEVAWAIFSRTYIGYMLGADGKEALRAALDRRLPHILHIPLRFVRTRRPG
jgi:SAM-dependent methyltransferase